MPISFNEINEKANGGTEYMARRLNSLFKKKELENIQIIPSRVRELMEDKVRVFWCHDLPGDPESDKALKDNNWENFDKIVFVSYWQKQQYINYYNIPYNKCVVMQNAIDPIEETEKNPDKIQIIYHTTPHRGLDLAYYAVNKLSEHYPDIEFHVYSSFKIYGWEQRDEQYKNLFSLIDKHPNMVYHGTVSNEEVRKAVGRSHIFAYPSIWPETSCISLMEAMSGKCLCVHSDLAALPETAANWTYMYNYLEDKNEHAGLFTSCLESAIVSFKTNPENINMRLSGQKSYTDLFYGWQLREVQWKQFISAANQLTPRKLLSSEDENIELVYNTG